MSYQCLLFDLDGTLIDSRADLINSVNLMLAEMGRPTLPDSKIINFVGEGVRRLVERSLRAIQPDEVPESEIDRAISIYRRHYGEHLLDQTRVYPEVKETLTQLAAIPQAIVTNKPYEFTVTVLEGLGLSRYFTAVLGGDSVAEKKPDPEMLLEAARRCGALPSRCLMVGDSRVDIAAGKAAGMKTCGYIPGFRGRTELAEAGADFLIERFCELRDLVEGLDRQSVKAPSAQSAPGAQNE
ncbi:MAG TPA: phosphoglycolate phosphatase [Blastocatellia bacterium]|nr:phosphoglycolate phosphatase [Blastocatellia bacterium]